MYRWERLIGDKIGHSNRLDVASDGEERVEIGPRFWPIKPYR